MQTIVAKDYASAKPFPYMVLDGGLVDLDLLEQAASNLPPDDDEHWFTYSNPLEHKRVCNKVAGTKIADVFGALSNQQFVDELSELTGIKRLIPDATLYGGGISVMGPGDFLKLHRDMQLNERTGLERRLNLVICMNKDWPEEFGGHLELWSDDNGQPGKCVRRIRHSFGRVILFDPAGWHGIPDPIECGLGGRRTSLQVFYYAPAREQMFDSPGTLPRCHAQFAPRPGECMEILNSFRQHCRV